MIAWVHKGLLATSQRPGYRPGAERTVPRHVVEAWLEEKQRAGIASILCLLAGDQLPLYARDLPQGLLRFYEESGFAVVNLASPDGMLEPYTPVQLEAAWQAFQELPKPVLVHCSAGYDRTGRVVNYLLRRMASESESPILQ
jgi:Tyrosine phosphatase family